MLIYFPGIHVPGDEFLSLISEEYPPEYARVYCGYIFGDIADYEYNALMQLFFLCPCPGARDPLLGP